MSSMKKKTDAVRTRTRTQTARGTKTVTKGKTSVPNPKITKAPLSNGFDADHEKVKRKVKAVSKGEKLSVKTAGNTVDAKANTRKRKAEVPAPKTQEAEVEQEAVSPPKLRKVEVSTKAAVKQPKVLLEVPKLPTASGVIFVIGTNDVGQLGFGESVQQKSRPAELKLPTSFVDIAAGGMHSVCLTDKGEVYTFGCNDEGALGRPTEDDEGSEYVPKKVDVPGVVVKVSAGDSHSAALTDSGQVYIWGNFRSCEGSMGLTARDVKHTTPIQLLTGIVIVNISSGSEHLVCLSNEGFVYTCGCGEQGQLGRVTERSCKGNGRKGLTPLLQPDVVKFRGKNLVVDQIWTGSYSTFIRAKDSGDVYVFGLNNYNQLGFENERVQFHPKRVTSFSRVFVWQKISGGQHHTLALDKQGQTYSLGRKDYGRLGLGENCEEMSTPTAIPTLAQEKCVDISSGNCVSFSVTNRGAVYSWGMGTNCQLGHGDEEDSHIPKLIEGNLLNSWHVFKVSGGGMHTLILANRKAVTEEKSSAKSDTKQQS